MSHAAAINADMLRNIEEYGQEEIDELEDLISTGATTAENLAYASRLGLWGGPEAPFTTREDFLDAMDKGGVAAMELVARELKDSGVKVTRIASGVPHGGDLEYADPVTLGQAVQWRKPVMG